MSLQIYHKLLEIHRTLSMF